MELTRNEVELCGTVAAPPVFSHENHGVRFYRVPLAVARLSGQTDTLPLLVRAPLPPEAQPGARVRALGQLRSYNNRTGPGSRLVLTVHVSSLDLWDGEAVNRVLLRGTLCKLPTLRRTPLGRSICDLILAVNRHYGRADYLPCIAWGRTAVQIAGMDVGTRLTLEGRVQSRTYTKLLENGSEERTAFEVSVMQLVEDPAEYQEEAAR